MKKLEIRPQAGKQVEFLSSPADIVIYGGAAGGGKTFGLLLSPLLHIGNAKFGAVIFRKNYTQIMSEGGLVDESRGLYQNIKGAIFLKSPPARWVFPSGAKISFAHIERDDELSHWQGSQICEICFDELTHFTERQFFYMLSRNRSVCGVKPYIRATCNPNADSWVAKLIDWWIDQETGYPIEERSGVLRWFIRRNEQLYFADNPSELWEQFGLNTEEERQEPRSLCFIASTVYDNKILLEKNASYLGNLKALSEVERERLLYGNWKIKPTSGSYFKRTQLADIKQVVPDDVLYWVRSWDLAATAETEKGDPAYTAGVLMGKRKDGTYIIADVVNVRQSASEVRNTIRYTAREDNAKYKRVKVRIPQDPGQAGKAQAQSFIKFLSGLNVTAKPESGSKETRAEPVAAQWQAGNFSIVYGSWNDMYLSQLEGFPISKFKDMVDATSSAFDEIEEMSKFNVTGFIT